MSDHGVTDGEKITGSSLLSRSTIAILSAILLIHSGAVVGIAVGRMSPEPASSMCLISAFAGIVSFIGLQAIARRRRQQ